MIDQSTFGANTDITNMNISSETVSPPPPSAVPPPSQPTVVIPGGGRGLPKWFILLFLLTLTAFIAVTILLVSSLKTQKEANKEVSITPSPIPAATPTIEIIFTPSPTPAATDSAILELENLSETDEINNLEADIKNTDFSSLTEGLSDLDKEMGFTSFQN